MLGRLLLGLAGLMLLGTAILHGLGGPSAAGWVGGGRGLVVELLWYGAALAWAVTGLAWLLLAWRGDRQAAPLVWLLAVIPAGMAAMALYALGPALAVAWLLAGAALFAILGAIALPRVRTAPDGPST